MRANLQLRTASRVLVRVASFRATAFFEVEKRAKKIDWQRFIGADRVPEFRVTSRKSKLYHSDAIAERLMKATPPAAREVRKDAPVEETQLFVVRVHRDDITISADSSGALLHMRGYRQAVAKAPLRETLAAALLIAADWSGATPLLDPFCGSGTIPIEAALLARRIPPGWRRTFAFRHWQNFVNAEWEQIRRDAEQAILPGAPVWIGGSDRDAGAIKAARENAERASTSGDIDFEIRSISDARVTTGSGLVVTNPPYGVRVGDRGDVRDLYARFGQVLRGPLVGWSAAFLSPDARLAAQLQSPAKELFQTTNGGIKVVALRVEGSRKRV